MRRGVPGPKQREIQDLVDCSSLSERAAIRKPFEDYLKECQLIQKSRQLTEQEKAYLDVAVETIARIDTTNVGKGRMFRFTRRLGLLAQFEVNLD
jgi:hypothetical protein